MYFKDHNSSYFYKLLQIKYLKLFGSFLSPTKNYLSLIVYVKILFVKCKITMYIIIKTITYNFTKIIKNVKSINIIIINTINILIINIININIFFLLLLLL